MSDDGLDGWRNLDVLALGLDDEQFELVSDVVRRLVLGERVSVGERDAVVALLAPIAAEVGMAQLEAFLADDDGGD
jgi:hypothetical protein